MRPSRMNEVEADHFSWNIIKDIFPYLIEYKRRVLFAVGFMILAKVASVGLPFILKYIVDGIDTTVPLFRALLEDQSIHKGEYNIHWLENWLENYEG